MGPSVVQPRSPATILRTPKSGGKRPLSRRTRHTPSRPCTRGPRHFGRELASCALGAEGQELAADVGPEAPPFLDRRELVDFPTALLATDAGIEHGGMYPIAGGRIDADGGRL
jgi:hypothetical protein